ncbi:MAG TPA: hypothetical protein VHJ20_21085 [Polyangia bacterium]|nr:hypothetical protein [Polyangia bacterium]
MTLLRWVWTASLGCALALGVAACGSSSSNGTGGAGGTGGASGGTGGATGTGGTTGTGGATGAGGAVSCGDLPTCVATLVQACPLVSSCSVAASASGDTSTHKVCLSNGVKIVRSVTNNLDTGASMTAISVTKNGTVCYTLDGTSNSNDPITTPQVLAFKDASGTTVATFSTDFSATPSTVRVTCMGGQPVTIPSTGNCGLPSNPEPDDCIGGSCTAP